MNTLGQVNGTYELLQVCIIKEIIIQDIETLFYSSHD